MNDYYPRHNEILHMQSMTPKSTTEKFKNICGRWGHYSDIIMSAMVYQITGVSIALPVVCSGADQRKHQSSASLAFMRGIHR